LEALQTSDRHARIFTLSRLTGNTRTKFLGKILETTIPENCAGRLRTRDEAADFPAQEATTVAVQATTVAHEAVTADPAEAQAAEAVAQQADALAATAKAVAASFSTSTPAQTAPVASSSSPPSLGAWLWQFSRRAAR
jgi:cell division septation protein DedD